MNKLLDGKQSASKYVDEVKETLLIKSSTPTLKVLLVGNNPASESYVKNKVKLFSEAGAICDVIRYTDTIDDKRKLAQDILTFNEDTSVNGIIIQLPLPNNWNTPYYLNIVNPDKDVDGFVSGTKFRPCTPEGVLMLIDDNKIETDGKDIVVIGRSIEVGRPLANYLSDTKYNGTVTICHSHTKNLKEHIARADIVISAVGKPEFIDYTMIKDNAICIDIGINRVPDETKKSGFRLCGDFKIDENLINKCQAYTPTPGGTGPMTVAALLKNTVTAWNTQNMISLDERR